MEEEFIFTPPDQADLHQQHETGPEALQAALHPPGPPPQRLAPRPALLGQPSEGLHERAPGQLLQEVLHRVPQLVEDAVGVPVGRNGESAIFIRVGED